MKKQVYLKDLKHLLVIPILAMLFCANTVFAQTNLPDRTEAPFCLVIPTIEDTRVDFQLQSTNVNATISGVIASVEIEQVYQNSGEAAVDATYVFPMSSNAAVYDMRMVLDGRVIDADIKEKVEAQQIFDEAKDNGQTASLLDQERPNVFQMSLANIQPGQELKMVMTYTELIEPEKGIYQFVLPNLVGPRYFETLSDFDWAIQTNIEALTGTIANTDLNIDLKINAGMNVTANCTSHDAPFTYEGQTASCSLQTNPGKDFIVDYSLEGNQVETGLLLYEGEEENYFLGIVQPPRLSTQYQSPPREYVFIVDISGSMRGQPLDISKDMMRNLFSGLNSNDRFNIIFFAGSSSVYSPNSLPVTPQNVSEAIAFIDNIRAGGGTRLLPAMQRALSLDGTDNYSRTFVILTDGFVTVEKQAFQMIRQNLNNANFFAFGIGRNVNRYIIEGIGYIGEGESFVVTDFNNAETTANDFKEYIERPALTNINVQFSGVDVYDVEPLSIPDVFAERPVLIYGKYNKSCGGSLTLTGDLANSQISTTLNFSNYQANAEENEAIQYLWARKKIQLLADYGLSSSEEAVNIKEEVTQLGLQYHLVTEFTSFIAVDDNAITGIDETNTTDSGAGGGTTGSSGTGTTGGGTTGGAAGPAGPSGGGAAGPSGPVGPTGPVGAPPAGAAPPAFVPNYSSEPLPPLPPAIAGCNDEDGSCLYQSANSSTIIKGCTDANAMNYNATAVEDDCSCRYENSKDGSLFNTYTWLREYVNPNDCEGTIITVYDAGSYNFVLIQTGEDSKLYFENGSLYCTESPTYSCVDAYGLTTIVKTWTCESAAITEELEEAPIFNNYTWLSDYVDRNNCEGTIITVYDAGVYNFVLIQTGEESKLYFENGGLYCTESPTYSCLDAYGLTTVVDTWACESAAITEELEEVPIFDNYRWLSDNVEPNNCEGTSITVYDAGSYHFVLIENGAEGKLYFENGTLYCNQTPTYSCVDAYGLTTIVESWTCGSNSSAPIIRGCTDATALNYNAAATEEDGSCEFETASGSCNNYTGTFFYDNCGGTSYYFIELEDGRIFDPYFAEGLEFGPREGQRITFEYEIKDDVTTPCTISESPITITCYELIEGSLFEDFSWLPTLIDENDCGTASVSLYNLGSYSFVFVETGSSGNLYYQDGTFYCADGPDRSCLSLYNLNTPNQVWECNDGNTRVAPHFNKSPKLMETFTIRPNPAKDRVFIDLPVSSAAYEIKLMDISGKLLKQLNKEPYTTTIEIDVTDLSQGIYLVELGNGISRRTQKLIVGN